MKCTTTEIMPKLPHMGVEAQIEWMKSKIDFRFEENECEKLP